MKKTAIKIFVASLLVFGGAAFYVHNLGVQRTETEDAVVLLKNGEYKSAITKLTALANDGNRFAQYDLGMVYALGWGVAPDAEKAAKLLRGNTSEPTADFFESIARSYASGKDVKQDHMEAEKWRQLAMEERKK